MTTNNNAAPAPVAFQGMSAEDIQKLIESNQRLQAEMEALKKNASAKEKFAFEMKMGEKGGLVVSFPGSGRFPLTVYFFRLLNLLQEENLKKILSFMAANFKHSSHNTEYQRTESARMLAGFGLVVSAEHIAQAKVKKIID